MNIIMIGSRALPRKLLPLAREHSDIDFFYLEGFKPCFKAFQEHYRVEAKPIPFHVFEALKEHSTASDECFIPSLDALYTLKLSHIFFPIHWDKNMKHLQAMQKAGCTAIEPLFEVLYSFWQSVHGSKKQIKLNKSNEEFFSDNVSRKFVHDDLHKVLSFNGTPLYLKCKNDPSRAYIEQSLFERMSHEDRINMVLEEIFVTALERHLIPVDFRMSERLACIQAYKKLVTSMTKGWFPRFMIDNSLEIFERFKESDIQNRFQTSLDGGEVRCVAAR